MNQQLSPHRGTLILILGILSLVTCPLFGIASWMMGNEDLAEMDAGRMDPEGRGLTEGGKICGMVSIGLSLLGLVIGVVGILFFGGLALLQG